MCLEGIHLECVRLVSIILECLCLEGIDLECVRLLSIILECSHV